MQPPRKFRSLRAIAWILVHAMAALDLVHTAPAGEPASDSEVTEPMAGSVLPPSPFRVSTGLDLRSWHDDNIFIQPERTESDVITSITPSITLALGAPGETFFTLDYSPSLVLFAEHGARNALDHDARAALEIAFSRLKLAVDAGYRRRSDASVETGSRTQRDVYTAAADAIYAWSERTSLELGVRGGLTETSGFFTTSDVSLHAGADYLIAPSTTVGAEASAGWVIVEKDNPRPYQEVWIRSSYHASELLSFTGGAGADFRDSGGGSDGAFVFDLGLKHQPFDPTEIALTAGRRFTPSAVVADGDRETLSAAVSIRQRFLQRVYVSALFSYEQSEYGGALNRRDDTLQLRTGISTKLGERWLLEMYYRHWRNASSIDGFDFSSNQVGVSLSISL